ncbi:MULTISPECIES: thiol peroxidase [Helcococcus]|uniref:Thiol peroxidase n=1 Tax=Helcococcus bovis TaxID=3153252 RepID=A0ABW9F6H5_9FIRM
MEFKFKGNPIHLLGTQVKVGDKAPDFKATKADMTSYQLSEDLGKTVVLSVVPSVDTSLCSIQTKLFNEEATKLSEEVRIVTVSLDLPFAQQRFCAAEGIENIITVSDYKEREFGNKYGFLIDELKLLARGIVIVDREGNVAYTEYLEDSATEVDFKSALEKVKELLK